MTPPAAIAVASIAAYLVGSLPFGYLLGRWIGNVDVRAQGSGNIGATNVGRVLGKKWGAIVLLLDALKGFLPTLLLPWLFAAGEEPLHAHLQIASGAAAMLGHMFPVWLRFKGGKGVATALGIVFVISWISTLGAAAVFIIVFAAFRIVSLGSMLAVVGYAVCEMFFLWPAPFSETTWSRAAFAILGPILIIVRHRSNLLRLLRGEEKRFTSKGEGDPSGGSPPPGADTLEGGSANR